LVVRNNFEVSADINFPKVTLARAEDPIVALNQSLDAIGGIRRFIKPGETVTVKPNVGWDRSPEQAANTNPILVAEMTRLCLKAGAASVIVTDVSCNDPRRCFLRSGIKKAVEDVGGKVILPTEDDYVKVRMSQKFLSEWLVLKHFIYTDKLINMPIVKHHSLTECTIGMKNLYGILGGSRNQLHQEIDQSIVDLAIFSAPTLTVIDATRVLLRGGPQGGSLDYVGIENSVICATDQVAADARASEFIGLKPENVGHIVLADKSGVGSLDYVRTGYKEILG
jgi:uncharacterized protein (DUF362 family)